MQYLYKVHTSFCAANMALNVVMYWLEESGQHFITYTVNKSVHELKGIKQYKCPTSILELIVSPLDFSRWYLWIPVVQY